MEYRATAPKTSPVNLRRKGFDFKVMYEFLDPRFKGRNLMPINVVSYDAYELGARDAVSITFKDLDTGQVYVETIDKPKYEVYVLKREYWDKVTFMMPWEDIEKMDRYLISYHWRDQELADILGCKPVDVKYSPVIFGYDMSIEEKFLADLMWEGEVSREIVGEG